MIHYIRCYFYSLPVLNNSVKFYLGTVFSLHVTSEQLNPVSPAITVQHPANTLYLYVLCGSQKKLKNLPYTALTL